MKMDVLLSAMDLEDYSYIDTLNIKGDCIVINQCGRYKKENINLFGQKISYIETKERGLSRSRNMAIKNSTADICILCDNDVEYLPDYETKIMNAYKAHPEYDMIAFHVKSEINPVPVFQHEKKIGYLTSGKIISYEISFRREKIKDIWFNEKIGAGTPFKMGEENAFLYECLRRGLRIYYCPVKIAELRYEPTTWNTGFNKDYFESRGASFYAMTHTFWMILVFQYALRKHRLYCTRVSFLQSVRYMLSGVRKYIRDE